ncbi:phosphatase PAP2 family protein [Hyphomicrobium sp.]|uniref:phosphatase PAP2 family protein n=1 Tax=Hyphomicrobium sp. TaxID=82 RepID=UPI001D87D415|nr:phosphatase PAP2 family protein [Hyphomicrobium sp.]MBY0559752.1 phosphatase PAP2 family protein [Hyphomicrobium sp.]
MVSNEISAPYAAAAPVDLQRRTVKTLFLGGLAVGIASAVLFQIYPKLDLAVSERIFTNHQFIGRDSTAFNAARFLFNVLFYSGCAVGLVGCVITLSTGRKWLNLSSNKWLFLAICVLVGPLTVANLGFKDHWGRARPQMVVEFGGDKSFTPPLVKSTECPRNCSFFSGEASSIYVLGFVAAFLFPTAAGAWIASGVVLGSLCGFVRMTEGGHFLSDVIFAGVFMAITVALVQMLFSAISGKSEPV